MDREEAIETIRKNMPSDKSLPVYEALQTLVPELAESEDEKTRKELIAAIDEGRVFDIDKEVADRWTAYLEKQKEQKPAWSEEDEEHLKSIISTIEMCMKDCEDANAVLGYYDSDISWLKSLRPSWKPSEEQMEALKCAIADVARFSKRGGRQVELENEPYYSALYSLYEQLKKL